MVARRVPARRGRRVNIFGRRVGARIQKTRISDRSECSCAGRGQGRWRGQSRCARAGQVARAGKVARRGQTQSPRGGGVGISLGSRGFLLFFFFLSFLNKNNFIFDVYNETGRATGWVGEGCIPARGPTVLSTIYYYLLPIIYIYIYNKCFYIPPRRREYK